MNIFYFFFKKNENNFEKYIYNFTLSILIYLLSCEHLLHTYVHKYTCKCTHPKNDRCTLYIIIFTSDTWHLTYIVTGKYPSFCPEGRWKRISTVFPRDFQTNCEYFRCNYLVRWIMTAPDPFKGLVIKIISPNKIKRCTYAAIWKSKVRLLLILYFRLMEKQHQIMGSA